MLVALCAHDGSKDDLEEWAGRHSARLQDHDIISTGGTARMLEDKFGFKVRALPSGPRGGDVVLAGLLATEPVGLFIYLQDVTRSYADWVDDAALNRQAILHNVPTAVNKASADALAHLLDWNSTIQT
jgi:methylglyoxal synthase